MKSNFSIFLESAEKKELQQIAYKLNTQHKFPYERKSIHFFELYSRLAEIIKRTGNIYKYNLVNNLINQLAANNVAGKHDEELDYLLRTAESIASHGGCYVFYHPWNTDAIPYVYFEFSENELNQNILDNLKKKHDESKKSNIGDNWGIFGEEPFEYLSMRCYVKKEIVNAAKSMHMGVQQYLLEKNLPIDNKILDGDEIRISFRAKAQPKKASPLSGSFDLIKQYGYQELIDSMMSMIDGNKKPKTYKNQNPLRQDLEDFDKLEQLSDRFSGEVL